MNRRRFFFAALAVAIVIVAGGAVVAGRIASSGCSADRLRQDRHLLTHRHRADHGRSHATRVRRPIDHAGDSPGTPEGWDLPGADRRTNEDLAQGDVQPLRDV